jgi:hypothetical protein
MEITREQLERLWNAIEYTKGTIGHLPRVSSEDKDWVLIHRGRAHQAMSFLIEANEIIESLRREGSEAIVESSDERTALLDRYVNFIMDSMPRNPMEQELYDCIIKKFDDMSKEDIEDEIRESYGEEWFEEYGTHSEL